MVEIKRNYFNLSLGQGFLFRLNQVLLLCKNNEYYLIGGIKCW
jgi:hypothetical protein